MYWHCGLVSTLDVRFSRTTRAICPTVEKLFTCSEQRDVSALVVASTKAASTIDELIMESGLNITLKVHVGEQKGLSNWVAFSTLLTSEALHADGHGLTASRHDLEDIGLIIFTSGTTSHPKVCPHTHRSVNANLYDRIKFSNLDTTSIYCSVMPNNHMNGCLPPLAYRCMGGTVIYLD